MLRFDQRGKSTSFVVLTLVLAALTGCWDNLVYVSADGSSVDARDGAPLTDATPTDTADVTDAPSADVVDAGMTDVSCPTGLTRCGATCVNTAADTANCGRCGGACPTGIMCAASNCVDAISAAPSQARRFYIENPTFASGGGSDRTWTAFRAASRSEYLDEHLSMEGYYAPIAGRAYKIGRVALRFATLAAPPGARISAARLEFRSNGRWADPARTILVVVPFTPVTTGGGLDFTDFATSNWGMASVMGETPNAAWMDGGVHPIQLLEGLPGLSAATGFWLGVVTGHDRDNVAPPDLGGTLSGMEADPASVRLRASYTFAP